MGSAFYKMKNQWRLEADEITAASVKVNKKQLPPGIDCLLRAKTARFIFDVAVEMSLPQITISTACVYMHRFYLRQPFHVYNHYDCGAAALFLACKVEETLRPVPEFIQQLARVASKKPSLTVLVNSKEYRRWLDRMLMIEQVLLETICFDLYVHHPYAHIQPLVDRLLSSSNCALKGVDRFNMIRLCWLLVNDSMRTTCCLLFQPLQLAAALLIIAGDELQLDTANWSQLLSSSNDDNNFTAVNNNDIADGASSSALVSDEIVRIVRALIEQVYSMPEIRHTLEGRFAARALIQHSSRSGDETGGHLRKRINSNKHSSSNSSSVQSPKRTRTNN